MHICNVQNKQIHTKQWLPWDFPGGLVATTPRSQCRRPGFNLWSGSQIPYATTKTQCSQINKYLNNSNHNRIVVAKDLGERGLRVATRGHTVSLGCTSQAYKAHACPASRLKKDPRVSNRNISGLRMGGAYMSEARSCSGTPQYVWQKIGRRGPGGNLHSRGEGKVTT